MCSLEGMLLRELTPTEAAKKLPSSNLMDGVRNTACRCLFGRPSSDVSDVQAYLDDCSRRRWNFDFAVMQPLPAGRFEWTGCAADTLPVPVLRSIGAQLVIAVDSPECKTGARTSSPTDIADSDFQLSLSDCRLPGQSSTSPLPLSGTGYATTLFHIALS